MVTTDGNTKTTTSIITSADKWDHVLARVGYKRSNHRVEPGLYVLGNPSPDSKVFVTANYTLSFDALRSVLETTDCYILVLDTQGINVWCAAGKGTFGTEELVKRIQVTGLSNVLRHRSIILPQLGAPGVAAHEVQKRTGFKVEYGPVRASDLPAYLKAGGSTPEMRQVHFTLRNRLAVTPIEMLNLKTLFIIGVLILLNWNSPLIVSLVVTIWLGGTFLFPVFLPWFPTREFTSKGLILGGLLSVPFWWQIVLNSSGESIISQLFRGVYATLLLMSAVAFLALNFTGSSTYTSRTGVKREIFRFIPAIAVMFITGFALTIVRSILGSSGVI